MRGGEGVRRSFSALFVVLLLVCGALACQHRPKTPVAVGAPAVMYQLQSIQTTWQLVSDPPHAEGESWELVMPPESLEDCDPVGDPCGCAGVFRGTASLVFIPEQHLKVHWYRQSGTGGHYGDGVLVEDGEDWRYEGPMPAPDAECTVTETVWNAFRRLLEIQVFCRWESEDGLCRGEDRISVVFPTTDPLLPPPPEELPWGEEIEGETFRFGDDPNSIPVPGFFDPKTAPEQDSDRP